MMFENENEIVIDAIDHAQPKIVKVLCRNCMPQHSTSQKGGYVTVCINCESFNQRSDKFKCKCSTRSTHDDNDDAAMPDHQNWDVCLEDGAGDREHDPPTTFDAPCECDEIIRSGVSQNDRHMGIFEAQANNNFNFGGSIFNADHYFTEANGFSNNSAIYFINEHEHGHGLKSIVYRCMKTHKQLSGFESVSDEQANFTLHSALQFYKMSRSEICNICTMNEYTRSRHEKEKLQIKAWYNDAVRTTLESIEDIVSSLSSHNLEDLVRKVSVHADKQLYGRRSDPNDPLSAPLLILPDVRDVSDVRRFYTEGDYSLVKLLPHPTVKEEHIGGCEFAHVSVEEIFNHILGHGYSCHYYRAGYEEDWSLRRYVDLYPKADTNEQERLL